jgi:hypothetical protein
VIALIAVWLATVLAIIVFDRFWQMAASVVAILHRSPARPL